MTDENGQEWLVGLRDLPTKSAEDTLNVWKEILSDISERCKGMEEDGLSVGDKLLLTIHHTMSDRAATCVKFDRLLEVYINEVLPLIQQTPTDQLGEAQQEIVRRLNNFFCSLHSLVHYADLVDKTALQHEVQHFDGIDNVPILNPSWRQAGESAAARTVRVVCKALSRGGDEKSGVYDKALTYLLPILKQEFDAHSLPITPYLRNRFAIFFHNSSVIYCLYDHLVEFFSLHNSNLLLKNALSDLKELFFVANIRGAGLISKTIIAPLWNTIEDKSVDLSQMSDIYALLKFLEEASVNPQMVLNGNSPFPERYLRKDKYWDKIFAPDERFDALTLSALAMFMPALAIFTKQHFADQLPGGRYADLQSADVKGVPKHNKLCERIFGLWDMAKR